MEKRVQVALICVLIAGLMPYLWTTVSKAAGPRYDNADVRGWQARLTGLPQRAFAAHVNSFEAFPLFAAAVLAAFLTGADPQRVMQLAIAFVVLRLLYGLVYLMNVAWLRSLVWFGALGCSVAIFTSALSALSAA
jgi:uncharacterized MAPEG superfamily protein